MTFRARVIEVTPQYRRPVRIKTSRLFRAYVSSASCGHNAPWFTAVVCTGGDTSGPTPTRYFRGARRKKVLAGSFSVTPMRPYARPTNAASCTFATSGLRWQARAARADQARIGRLEAPEGPADRAFEVNVLIV